MSPAKIQAADGRLIHRQVKRQLKLQAGRRRISLWRLAVLLLSGCSVAPGEELLLSEPDLKISLWNYEGSLRGSFGYKDNVLLSHTNAQGSAFWMSGAEFMVFRLPTHGWQFNFFADATDLRFFNSPSVNNEQVALAVAQLSKDFGNGWKSTLGLNYLFQNQVFDNSANYTNQTTVGVIKGNTLSPRWAVRKTFDPVWIDGELTGTRQWLDSPLDSYRQFGPRLATGFGWNPGSELVLSYQYSRLDYDSREQVSSTGMVLTNTALALNTHSVELSLTQIWDEKRHWQTISAAGFEASLDNGSGYYDYDNYRVSQRLRYRDEQWEATAQARVNYFVYSTQTVSATDASLRSKTMFNLLVRVERRLTKHLLAQADYTWDRSLSNLDFDDYQASTITGGLAFTF